MNLDRRRQLAALLLAILALVAAVGYAANPVTRGAQDYARGVAAASGGVIVSGSAQPLKVLEPIDDTVERIAGVVFFMMVATGVIGLAMGPVTAIGFGLLGMAALLSLTARDGRGGTLVRPLGIHGCILAIAVPFSFLVASLLADWMTASVWAEHDAILAEISATVAPEVKARGLDGWRDLLENAKRYGKLATGIYDRADELVASFVAILAVLLIKVLVLPLVILGAFVLLARNLSKG